MILSLLLAATAPIDAVSEFECTVSSSRGVVEAVQIEIESRDKDQFWTITPKSESSISATKQRARFEFLNGDSEVVPWALIETNQGDLYFELLPNDAKFDLSIFHYAQYVIPGGMVEERRTEIAAGPCSLVSLNDNSVSAEQ